MSYRLEWSLVGRAGRLLDAGGIDGEFPDPISAQQALHAFLATFALRGRDEAGGYWWGRRSAGADLEVRVVLRRTPTHEAGQDSCPRPTLTDHEGGPMTSEDRKLLHKAATNSQGQIAVKRGRCGAWHPDRDRLDALARCGHLIPLGERMGPHLGGTFALWQITTAGRALAERSGGGSREGGGAVLFA